MNYSIKISVDDSCNTKIKGDLLESLAKEIMEAQQYYVSNNVRQTGMELDLVAKHKYSGEEIIVECKAWENNINAGVIRKLMGDVAFEEVSSGWLITTSHLGKDAEGLRIKWQKKSIEKRKKLMIFTPPEIIELLISNKIVIDAKNLVNKLPENFIYNDKACLFITNKGKYWIFSGNFSLRTIETSVIVFEAVSGKRVFNKETLQILKKMKSIYSDYKWLYEDGGNEEDEEDEEDEEKIESQNIVTVMSGDTWSDYRPSRPKDYVGRKCLISSIFDFFEDILKKQTNTRLFALKSPSGWGKSSTILKMVDESKKHRFNQKYYIYAVDTRTALSSRYAELVFKSCLESAIKDKFIVFEKEEIVIGDIIDVTNTDDVKRILNYLRNNNKVIILIFDQFEEIFYKENLYDLFNNMRKISNTIDAIKENIVMGYAWKTDFSISSDHPAYYLWSNLKDRRKEFDLLQFTNAEIKGAIKVFGKELGQKINPLLARYLLRQCQGYPWLLKKLCIHVYGIVKQGNRQEDAIEQTLDIGKLFEKECAELTSQEYECIKQIAKDSPADYFRIVDVFGQDVLQMLINRRIVIKRASKLTLYWDIFKDYVLGGKLPVIYTDYIPQIQFSTFFKVVSVLIENNGKLEITKLSQQTLLGRKTVDNILIDLYMFGIVYREKNKIILLEKNYSAVMLKIRLFFKKHIIWLNIQKDFGEKFNVEEYDFLFNKLYNSNQISEKTKRIYSSRLLELKLIVIDNNFYVINYKVDFTKINWNEYKKCKKIYKSRKWKRRTNRKNSNMYWPQVSPRKMKTFYQQNEKYDQTATMWIANGNKKVIEDLIILGAAWISEEDELKLKYNYNTICEIIKNKVNIKFALEKLQKEQNLTVQELAICINDNFNKNWSEGTKRVTGAMIYRWCKEFSIK